MSKGKINSLVLAAEQLSLGISMVVAVGIGLAMGYYLRKFFGYEWLFWFGVFVGFAAAFLNVYKAYKRQNKELESLKDDPRYKNYYDFDKDDECDKL